MRTLISTGAILFILNILFCSCFCLNSREGYTVNKTAVRLPAVETAKGSLDFVVNPADQPKGIFSTSLWDSRLIFPCE